MSMPTLNYGLTTCPALSHQVIKASYFALRGFPRGCNGHGGSACTPAAHLGPPTNKHSNEEMIKQ
eukprot:278738-Pelagomonas_calceolata.AAC.1